MTITRSPRSAAVALILLSVLAVTVAACGSSTGSPATTSIASPVATRSAGPSEAAAAGSPAESAGASSAPVTTADPNATPLPTFTRDAALEAMLPKTLDGKPLSITSLSGTDVMTTGRPADQQALQAILAATGGTPADYGFAYSIVGDSAVVGVFRVKGADPAKVRDSFIEQGKAASGAAGSPDLGTIGGKQHVTILRFTQGGTQWSSYYWPKGDVLYFVQTADAAVAESFFSSL